MTILHRKSGESVLRSPQKRFSPIVLASPHSGYFYPSDFLKMVRLPISELRRSEDCFVDELFADGPDIGVPLLSALFPRCLVDVNRSPNELDPKLLKGTLPFYADVESSRVRAGIGVIPRLAASGAEIYSSKLPVFVARERLLRFYFVYHRMLRDILASTRNAFGSVILLDCHSMPSTKRPGSLAIGPDIVLGNQYGKSCSHGLIEEVERIFCASGYTVERNTPYAGGFVTNFYGKPECGYEVLQIEINRALYMNEQTFCRNRMFSKVKKDMTTLIKKVSERFLVDVAAE